MSPFSSKRTLNPVGVFDMFILLVSDDYSVHSSCRPERKAHDGKYLMVHYGPSDILLPSRRISNLSMLSAMQACTTEG